MNFLDRRGVLQALAFLLVIPVVVLCFVFTYAFLKDVGVSKQADLERAAVNVDLDYWFANAIASHTDRYLHAFTPTTYGRSSTDTVLSALQYFATSSPSHPARYKFRATGHSACTFTPSPRTISCEDVFWCKWPVPVSYDLLCQGPWVLGHPDYQRVVLLQDSAYVFTTIEEGVTFVETK